MKERSKSNIGKILFDREHTGPLVMMSDSGETVRFEEIYSVEREDGIYCILRPLASVRRLRPDSALLFHVDQEGIFRVVKDESLAYKIFLEYYNVYHDELGRGKDED